MLLDEGENVQPSDERSEIYGVTVTSIAQSSPPTSDTVTFNSPELPLSISDGVTEVETRRLGSPASAFAKSTLRKQKKVIINRIERFAIHLHGNAFVSIFQNLLQLIFF